MVLQHLLIDRSYLFDPGRFPVLYQLKVGDRRGGKAFAPLLPVNDLPSQLAVCVGGGVRPTCHRVHQAHHELMNFHRVPRIGVTPTHSSQCRGMCAKASVQASLSPTSWRLGWSSITSTSLSVPVLRHESIKT